MSEELNRTANSSSYHYPHAFPPRLVVLLAGVWVGMGFAVAPASTRERDFVDFLEGRDLVVEGRLIEPPAERRAGAYPNRPHDSTQFTIVVDRTWAGTASGSTIQINSLARAKIPERLLQPNTRVIGYGGRLPKEGFELWGGILAIDDNDLIFPPPGTSEGMNIHGFAAGARISISQLDSLFQSRIEDSGPHAFDGAHGVLMVRLGPYHDLRDGSLLYDCDSLGWVLPTQASAPRQLRFTPGPGCNPYTVPGDTLLLPLHLGDSDWVLNVAACPGAWRVKAGIAVGFGTTVEGLGAALGSDANGLFVRPIHALDALDPRFSPQSPLIEPAH